MNSSDDVEAADGYDTKDERNVDECEMVIRMAFIRKVYSCVYLQRYSQLSCSHSADRSSIIVFC
jgi:hypothetical protein